MTDLIPFIKDNSKYIIELNIKHNTIKLLEENLGKYLRKFRCGDVILDTTPESWAVKTSYVRLH